MLAISVMEKTLIQNGKLPIGPKFNVGNWETISSAGGMPDNIYFAAIGLGFCTINSK